MSKSAQKRVSRTEAASLFKLGTDAYERNKMKVAFRYFLAAAESGNKDAQVMVGNLYTDGIGVERDIPSGLSWYRRAWRNGQVSAATNIGITYRNANRISRALSWFERAVKAKDAEANLEIARIYLARDEVRKGIFYLKKLRDANPTWITEASRDEAEHLSTEFSRTKGKPNRTHGS